MDLDESKNAEVDGSQSSAVFKLIAHCIERVWDSKEVYDNFTIDEAIEFVSNIDVKSFEGIQQFFESAPVLKHELNYTNKLGNERQIILQGIQDFF